MNEEKYNNFQTSYIQKCILYINGIYIITFFKNMLLSVYVYTCVYKTSQLIYVFLKNRYSSQISRSKVT